MLLFADLELTLIWVGFLGARFEGGKTTPLSKTC